PFRDFVARSRLGMKREEHEAFFRGLLGDVDEPTAPFGLLNAQGDWATVRDAHATLPGDLSKRIRACAQAAGVSPASVMHLAWAVVVARASGRQDAVFGTVLFGRMQGGAHAERVLGMFINTLPVRIRLDDRGVAESLRGTHALLVDLLRHEHAPLALAQRCSGVPPRTPLFSSLFNYRHSSALAVSAGDAGADAEILWGEERTNYPLTLSVDDLGDVFLLKAQVATPVSAERVCALMETSLSNLVRQLEESPTSAVRSVSVLPPAERERVLYGWNATAMAQPACCLHELVEGQVGRTPDRVAVVSERERVSYRELNARANRLASWLRKAGVKPDRRVALCMERGVGMVVALLATLKSGGAYVPLEPSFPSERLRHMLADSAPVVALVDEAGRRSLAGLSEVRTVDVELDEAQWSAERATDEKVAELTPEHLAYVIYTSGSTGRPKGSMNAHRGVVSRVVWMQREYGFVETDVLLQKTPYTFDVSVWEFLCPLMSGATLVMARPEGHKEPRYIREAIARHGVTIV